MAISLVAIGDKIRASLINALITQVNGIALVGQIPTVSGTGVTVSPGGSVSFAGASTVQVLGAFSGTYDNYRIVWDIPSQTAGADLQMHLANAGTDDTTGNYSYTRGYDHGGTTNARTVASVTAASSFLLTAGASSSQTNFGYMDLSGPALSRYTAGLAQAVVHNTTPDTYTTSTNLFNSSTTAYDGFSIGPTSGTMTGTLRVYGYNNLT